MPLAGNRHAVLVDASQLVHAAFANQVFRFQDLLGRQSIGGTALIVLSPLGRPPLGTDRRIGRPCGEHADRQTGEGKRLHEPGSCHARIRVLRERRGSIRRVKRKLAPADAFYTGMAQRLPRHDLRIDDMPRPKA